MTALVLRGFLVPASPVDLAVVRIGFFIVALPVGLSTLAAEMADLPEGLRTVPAGAGWLYGLIPPDPAVARVGSAVMVVAALAALFGWRARAAAAVWGVVAVWVMGVPSLFGKVNHDHHLVWFALLLAASPCADVLSLDSLRRGAASIERHVRYGLPIRIWWLILGSIYFFPGFAKVAEQGLGWASPANMRPLFRGQWAAVEDFSPLVRLDEWPVALAIIGIATLLFELGFVVAVFSRFRAIAAVAGIGFHVGTHVVMNISFSSLMVCYVALVPWAASLLPAHRGGEPSGKQRPSRVTVVAAAVLVAGCVGFGASQVVEGWPFAAYPTFAERYNDERTTLEFELEYRTGESRVVSIDDVFDWVPDPRRQRIAGQLLRLDPRERMAVLREIELPADLRQGATTITVFEAVYSTDPDRSDLLSRTPAAELALPPQDP